MKTMNSQQDEMIFEEETSVDPELESSNVDPETHEMTLADRYRAGMDLTDQDLDCIADTYLEVIKNILKSVEAEDSKIIEYLQEDDELYFDILNPDLAVMIGRHGKTLEAFQHLVNAVANNKLGFRYPVSIDIESYKKRQGQKIIAIAEREAKKAVETGRTIYMRPMSAYERRVVHIALREYPGVNTHSEGTDPTRRVVIVPDEGQTELD